MSNRAFLCLQRQGVQQFRIREKEGEKTACYQVVNKLLTKSQSYTSHVLQTLKGRLYIRGFTKSQITVAFCLKFYWYLRTLTETAANWAESGKHHFGSKTSEILILRSLNTNKTLGKTPLSSEIR